MTVLIADDVLSSGKVLGHYTPALTPEEAAAYARLKALFDLEAAERTLTTQRDQGQPLADILERLRAVGSQG